MQNSGFDYRRSHPNSFIAGPATVRGTLQTPTPGRTNTEIRFAWDLLHYKIPGLICLHLLSRQFKVLACFHQPRNGGSPKDQVDANLRTLTSGPDFHFNCTFSHSSSSSESVDARVLSEHPDFLQKMRKEKQARKFPQTPLAYCQQLHPQFTHDQ